MADLGDGTAAYLSYRSPTLYSAGQIVTYEYHAFLYKSDPTMKSWPHITGLTSFTGGSRRYSPMEDKEEDAGDLLDLRATASERMEESAAGNDDAEDGNRLPLEP